MIKTIAIFSGYHLPHLGGLEHYTKNLSKELIDKGIRVLVVTSNYDNLPEKEIMDGVEILRIPIHNVFTNRYPIPKRNKQYRDIINSLADYNIDAIIVNTRFHLTSLVGAKYGKKNNIPVFLIEHGSEHLTVDNKVLDYFGSLYEHGLTWYLKKFVDKYYGVSKEACNWQKHFKINSDGVWYNSILKFYDVKKIKKSNKKIIITYAGRVLKQKGLIELVTVFNKLSKEFSNIELHIAGDGNLLNELKKLASKNKKVIFHGRLPFDNLVPLYSKTNIFVYAPTWPEGLPSSVLEAGYMKCTVIASPHGGTKEIVDDNVNGLLISNQDELESALRKTITDKELRERLSENLHDKITKNFIWDKTAEKVLKDLNI